MLGAHGVRSPRPPGSAGALVDGGPSDGDGDGDGGIVIDGGAYSTRARARGRVPTGVVGRRRRGTAFNSGLGRRQGGGGRDWLSDCLEI